MSVCPYSLGTSGAFTRLTGLLFMTSAYRLVHGLNESSHPLSSITSRQGNRIYSTNSLANAGRLLVPYF